MESLHERPSNHAKSSLKRNYFGRDMPSYNHNNESTTHALIHCDVATKVWSNWTECPIKLPDTIYDISDIALKLLNNGTN